MFLCNAVYPLMYSDGSETSHLSRVLVTLKTETRDRTNGEAIYLLERSCSCRRCISIKL